MGEQRQVLDESWRRKVDERLEEHHGLLVEHAEKLERGNARFAEGESRMTALDQKISQNNAMTALIQNDTALIVKWVKNITGFNAVMNWLLSLLLKVAAALAALGILYWAVTTGQLPKKAEALPALRHALIDHQQGRTS